MSRLPVGLDTDTIRWRDPAETNPRGRLAGDAVLHPYGGLEVRSDALGQGAAVGLMDDPNPREWPAGKPTASMPLRTDGDGHLWAPPYPAVVYAAAVDSRRVMGGPNGDANDWKPISAPLRVTLVNPSPVASMLVERTVSVRSAYLRDATAEVSYDLLVDDEIDARWALFGNAPELGGRAKVDRDTTTKVITDVAVENVVALGTVTRWSGSISLEPVLVDPAAELTFKVQTGLTFYAEGDPFEVALGATTVVAKGTTIIPVDFGTAAVVPTA